MTTYYSDDQVTLHHGDALDVARDLADGSVDSICSSPPYFGLRDYGVPGTDWSAVEYAPMADMPTVEIPAMTCPLGLEPSPAAYVAHLLVLFRELRRVLADDGTLWLNIGDSYYSGRGNPGPNSADGKQPARRGWIRPQDRCGVEWAQPKNLLGIPWRTAFALQADGWILRNSIVWAKPNAMPESVTDRLSTKHEMVFLFSKRAKYWFDLDAIREAHTTNLPVVDKGRSRHRFESTKHGNSTRDAYGAIGYSEGGRNPGDVWTINTQPLNAAHFAVMPRALAERCIQAGCTPRRCTVCGHAPTPTKRRGGMDMARPQARRAMEIAEANGLTEEHFAAIRSAGVTDAGKAAVTQTGTGKNTATVTALAAHAKSVLRGYYREFLLDREVTDGWTDCGHNSYRAGTVLDPFSGSGTTGLAAARHGRRYVGIDLNREYLDLSLTHRLQNATLDFTEGTA